MAQEKEPVKPLRAVLLLLTLLTAAGAAAEPAAYTPSKVVYDVSSSDPKALQHILDRVSMLQNLYGSDPFEASIVIVLHEGAIPRFSKRGDVKLRDRARSLALGEIIRFRLCAASAKMQGYGAKDFDEFVAVVPMADAEIVKLQQAGYAYLR
jgi:intracellular sulfur oxidation DsrE/DsrF family protein